MTQSALAFAIGVFIRIVEVWEAGRNRPSGVVVPVAVFSDGDHSLLYRLIIK